MLYGQRFARSLLMEGRRHGWTGGVGVPRSSGQRYSLSKTHGNDGWCAGRR